MRHGKYRQARAALSGGATAITSQSTGGASANARARAIIASYESGAISYSELCSGLDAIDEQMTVASAFSGGLGIPHYSSALAQYQAMQQAHFAHAAVALLPPHPPTSLKSEGLRAGEIIAWRAWYIRGDELHSVVVENKPWIASEPMQGDAAAGYGVHAYKAPHGPLLDNYVSKGSPTPWVIGEVALWGDVIEHEEGYRAEFARVHSLVTWHEQVSREQRDRISKVYLAAPAFKLDDAA